MINEALSVISQLYAFVVAIVVPASAGQIGLVHVAFWVPVTLALLAGTGSLIKRIGRPSRAAAAAGAAGPGRAGRRRRTIAQRQVTSRAAARRTAERQAEQAKQAEAQAARQAAAAQVEAARVEREQKALARRQAAWEKRDAQAAREAKRAEAQAAREQRARDKIAKQEQTEAQRIEREQKALARRQAAWEKRDAQAARASQRPKRPTGDPTTRAFGTDPNRVYAFRYRVLDLDELITSNTDTGAINPAYDQQLQPRQRDRAASQRQIDQVARSLVPESLLWDFKQLDKGAPIIGADRMVESGNGRILALRRARAEHGDQFDKYQTKLRENLAALGLSESDLAGVSSPVVVRERLTDVDRAAFAREANAPPVLQMSTLETALVDSRRISDASILRLTVKEEQSIDQALRTKANADFVRDFTMTLSENERALLMRRDGTLAQAGIRRIKAAVFTRVFPGAAGERIAETFLESLDSTTKNFETGISATLPQLARVESLVASGQRAATISMSEDISIALDMLARIKEQDISARVYVEQATLFDRELTTFQERLLLHFEDIGRSPKKIREFLSEYASLVEDAPHPDQVDLFGDSISPTKEQLFDRIVGSNAQRKAA